MCQNWHTEGRDVLYWAYSKSVDGRHDIKHIWLCRPGAGRPFGLLQLFALLLSMTRACSPRCSLSSGGSTFFEVT